MQSIYDYKKFAILYVDDEEKSLKYFTRAFGDQFRIFTAPNAEEGFKIFEQHKDEIAVLMTDQRMPGEKGVQLLERVRQLRPRAIRILATAYSDIEAAIAAVNSGAIYKYIHKPWDVPQLEITLRRAIEFFLVQVERDQLLQQKLSVLQNIIITDRVIGLGVLAGGFGQHIRNPLLAVSAFLDAVPGRLRDDNVSLDALRNPNYWQDLYRAVQRQVSRVEAVLSDVKGNGEPGQFAFCDEVQIGEVVLNCLEQAQSEFKSRGIHVQANIPPTLPKLTADERKLRKIFALLFKAKTSTMGGGGSIAMDARQTEAGIELHLKETGNSASQDSHKGLFNPFVLNGGTTEEPALYLLAAYFLVYHHSGTIKVEVADNVSNTLSIHFPTKPQEVSPGQDLSFISNVVANDDLWDRLLSLQ